MEVVNIKKQKILLMGLDSVPDTILFDKFKNKLPTFKKILENGIFGTLESCNPPITVPAWMVMMTSMNPGRLGTYGFRHRKKFSYEEFRITNSNSIKADTIWSILGKNDKKSCLVGVPPTFPPPKINGNLISCFLTPSDAKEFTYPPELSEEIKKITGEYLFDVTFRTNDQDKIISDLYDMTEKRFTAIKHLVQTKEWDYCMFVEIGLDRLHHSFWKFFDTGHFGYRVGNKYENVIFNYYKFIDDKIKELLDVLDDDTLIFIVSDHGSKAMKGAFCINEWLIQKGYLVLDYPDQVTELEKVKINWEKTKAWGWGGYYGRIFLNMKGREAKGIIDFSDYEKLRNEISEEIEKINDPEGNKMNNISYKPEKLYGTCKGDKPDLLVYFDDLNWRSAGTIGHKTTYIFENDTGPDDSVHSMNGIFVFYDPKKKLSVQFDKKSIYDIAPTILKIFGIDVPEQMEGTPIPELEKYYI